MILIDTHTLIWLLSASDKLSDKAKEMLKSGDKTYVSIASIWEIAIKQSIGKLELTYSVDDIVNKCQSYKIDILPIKPAHIEYIKSLPFIHRDPFDRLLISQAKIEELTFISKDENIAKYDITVVW